MSSQEQASLVAKARIKTLRAHIISSDPTSRDQSQIGNRLLARSADRPNSTMMKTKKLAPIIQRVATLHDRQVQLVEEQAAVTMNLWCDSPLSHP